MNALELHERLGIIASTYDNHRQAAFHVPRERLTADGEGFTGVDRPRCYDLVADNCEHEALNLPRRVSTTRGKRSTSRGERSDFEGESPGSERRTLQRRRQPFQL